MASASVSASWRRIADRPFLWDLYGEKDLVGECCYRDGCLTAVLHRGTEAVRPGAGRYHRLMKPIRDPEVLARMDLAFDLYEAAEEMMRQNLRRRNPEATEEEIEEGIRDWLRRQPD